MAGRLSHPLCFWRTTRTGSVWGTPDENLCGLISYSISASMTGHYPKVLGSVMAPLFAVLIVQRTSNGLCSTLKLGWLTRFSPLVFHAGEESAQRSLERPQDEKTREVALNLWRRLEEIEFFGYLAGAFVIGLVALDTKYFHTAHTLLATLGFTCLYHQNYRVGTLGRDFHDLFPNWTSVHAARVFWFGVFHVVLMYVLVFVLGTIHDFERCDELQAAMESISIKAFGNPQSMCWLASVGLWYTEYMFGLTCIYIQLMEHYELQLWDFLHSSYMPYVVIMSRFSFLDAVRKITGVLRPPISDVDMLLGVAGTTDSCDRKVDGKKMKTG